MSKHREGWYRVRYRTRPQHEEFVVVRGDKIFRAGSDVPYSAHEFIFIARVA